VGFFSDSLRARATPWTAFSWNSTSQTLPFAFASLSSFSAVRSAMGASC
jgi:hypothetical protein